MACLAVTTVRELAQFSHLSATARDRQERLELLRLKRERAQAELVRLVTEEKELEVSLLLKCTAWPTLAS